MRLLPLAGIRVLALEQAVALPAATRHLADLGAEVIRVQSHRRTRDGGGRHYAVIDGCVSDAGHHELAGIRHTNIFKVAER